MSVFSSLFSPIGKWKENPNRKKETESKSEQLYNIDKVEKASVEGMEEINITGNVNIIISKTCEEQISVRIHGVSTKNYEIEAYVTKIEKVFRINVRGKANSYQDMDDNDYKNKNNNERGEEQSHTYANITMEVQIPNKMELKRVKIKNSNGNIIYKVDTEVDSIEIRNKNGNVELMAGFKKLTIDSKEGNVMVKSIAKSDLNVDIIGCDGTVSLSIQNIKHTFMQFQVDGSTIIHPEYSGEFNISGTIYVSRGVFIYS